MSSVEDVEFRNILLASGIKPENRTVMYDGTPINVSTEAGMAFRGEMRNLAAAEVGMSDFPEFSGEFEEDLPEVLSDRITESLMARLLNPGAPVRAGARLALTGTGLISTSQMGKEGYWPTLVDYKINIFGEIVAAGVWEYPFIDPDLILSGEATPDTVYEPCKGVVALLRRLEVRDAISGSLRPSGLVQAVVPLPVETLELHKVA